MSNTNWLFCNEFFTIRGMKQCTLGNMSKWKALKDIASQMLCPKIREQFKVV